MASLTDVIVSHIEVTCFFLVQIGPTVHTSTYINVKNVDPKNKKRLKKRVFMKIKNVKKRWIKKIDNKYTQLLKPNEKILKITVLKNLKTTVLVCMTMSDSYGSSSENI